MATLDDEIPDWAKSCPSGKQKFTSSEDARKQYQGKRHGRARDQKGTFHAYRCLDCDFYHVTSTARQRDGRKHRWWDRETGG